MEHVTNLDNSPCIVKKQSLIIANTITSSFFTKFPNYVCKPFIQLFILTIRSVSRSLTRLHFILNAPCTFHFLLLGLNNSFILKCLEYILPYLQLSKAYRTQMKFNIVYLSQMPTTLFIKYLDTNYRPSPRYPSTDILNILDA